MCPTQRQSSISYRTPRDLYQRLAQLMNTDEPMLSTNLSELYADHIEQGSPPNRNSGTLSSEYVSLMERANSGESWVSIQETSRATTSERQQNLSIQLIPSIPLDVESKQYWRDHGGVFFNRARTEEELKRSATGYDVTINLGASHVSGDNWPIPFYNRGVDIQKLITPGATRRAIPHLIPPAPFDLPSEAWIKRPGRGGSGKELTTITAEMINNLPREWDVQQHISGREYRVITVGPRVVQSTERTNPGRSPRTYEWRGLGNTPTVVKNAARAGAMQLSGSSFIGWDIMWDDYNDEAYILEGNSCPGVNEPTVERIVREVNRQLEEI